MMASDASSDRRVDANDSSLRRYKRMRTALRLGVAAAAVVVLLTAPTTVDAIAPQADNEPPPQPPIAEPPIVDGNGDGENEGGVDPVAAAPTQAPAPAPAPSPSPSTAASPAPSPSVPATSKPSPSPTPRSTPTLPPTPAPTLAPTPAPTLAPTPRPNIRVPADETPVPLPSANTSSLSGRTRSALGGANPAFFVGFAALCMAFMALWASRRRRSDGNDGMSGMATTSSHESGAAKETSNSASTANAGKYSRIENRPEDPFEDDDSFEYGARTGDWDDWEGETDDHDDRDGTRQLTKGMTSSSSPSAAVLPSYAAQSVSLSLSPSPPASQRRDTEGSRLKEILLSDSAPKSTSVASNSSNESFEVLPPTADLLSGGSLTPTKAAAQTASAPEDDLFSQFGMVPTFKNGVQQPQVSVSSSPVTRSPTSSPFTTPPASQRTSAAPAIGATALAASALFAADDSLAIAAADAADEWGEGDDDWAQDI